MGFLGLGNYAKPGKGVSKNEPEKKRFFLFFELWFRKFWKIIQVNLLYSLFFVPLVMSVVLFFAWGIESTFGTIVSVVACVVSSAIVGIATAGVTYILRSYSQQKHSFLLSDFFDTIKGNWKQASVTGVLLSILLSTLFFSGQFYFNESSSSVFYLVLFGLTALFGILLLFASYYVYLLIVTVDLKLPALYKNAFLLGILGLKTNLITTFFVALIVIPTVLFFPLSIVVFVVIIPALVQFILCFNSYQYIQKYCIDPFYAQNADQQPLESVDQPVFSDDILNDRPER